ncbi:MAG: hypothetical protein ICV59_03450 [Thermoleophilia bacterium]|nr:hypothetical protein [Thermoleophilia bacterium]
MQYSIPTSRPRLTCSPDVRVALLAVALAVWGVALPLSCSLVPLGG